MSRLIASGGTKNQVRSKFSKFSCFSGGYYYLSNLFAYFFRRFKRSRIFMSIPISEAVRSLLKDIQQLQTDVRGDRTTVPQRVTKLQAEFRQIVASISQADLTPEVEQRLRPCQTEGHRRLRLLGIEAMRLRTAKQAETVERVRSQLEDHLTQLEKFVEAIANEMDNPEV